MYIKLKNGAVDKYPYSISELKKDNPQTSFPSEISNALLAEHNVYKVEETQMPSVSFDKNIAEAQPQLVNGVWKQVWSVTDATAEEKLARVISLRKKEYPPMANYLDAIVKNDKAQIEKYINDCLSVKAKYPKP
jgi:hypothetical protein